jgi:hypothetical protein
MQVSESYSYVIDLLEALSTKATKLRIQPLPQTAIQISKEINGVI